MIFRTGSREAVDSSVGVALLEALRSSDTPPETLEAEDFSQSLPRRLGLSGVIERQIERYARLEDEGEGLPASDAEDLFRLIGRRSDAGDVFRRAGRALAERDLRGRSLGSRAVSRAGPGALARWMALRAAAGLARRVNPAASVRTERDPPSLVVEGSLPARACGGPEGCELLAEGLEAYLSSYAGTDSSGVHPLCESTGDSACVFRLEGHGDAAPPEPAEEVEG